MFFIFQTTFVKHTPEMNPRPSPIVLDTPEAYLNYVPRGVQRARARSSSTATTLPATPRKDVVTSRVWDDFSGDVLQMYNELKAGDMWKKHVSLPVFLSPKPFIDVTSEMNMATVHSDAVLKPMELLVHSFGIDGRFIFGNSGAALNPDGVWKQYDQMAIKLIGW
jgi:hypothetical protein